MWIGVNWGELWGQWRGVNAISIWVNIKVMESRKKQVQEYIAKKVNCFIQPLVYALVKRRPSDPVEFAQKWLLDFSKRCKLVSECSDSENQEETLTRAQVEEKIRKSKNNGKKQSRVGISSQVFGSFNQKDDIKLKDVPKTEEVKLLIKSLVRNSILFKNVERADEEALVTAMEEKRYQKGDVIITEGDAGDALYIVESGSYECYKKINNVNTYLKTYQNGEAFGELALMYNAPRAATIIATTPGILYSLDRTTFNHVVKGASARKRETFRRTIDKIELFSQMEVCEKEQFYDVLKLERFEAGQYVINQGEQGNRFYIVMEGNLVAEKLDTQSEFPKIVYKYKEGDYFGELAMIHDVCRQASVKTLTTVRLASIDRESFKRILGSLEDILKRNQERYKSVQNMICV